MTYLISYNVILSNDTLEDKQIKVKNKDNELMAKCALEDYLKRKYKDDFRQLVISKCESDIVSTFAEILGMSNDLFK
jgi:hypothetical protein